MSRTLNSREKFLIGVFVLVGLFVLYFQLGGENPFGDPAEEAPVAGPPIGEPPVVRMDLLALRTEEFDPQGRNLFTYYVPPRKPEPRPEPTPRKPDKPVPKPAVRKPPPPSGPRDPRPPSPDFKYIGYLGPKDDRIAVFEGDFDGDAVIVKRVGEIVKDQFELVEFKHEAVVFAYVDQRFRGKTAELKLPNK